MNEGFQWPLHNLHMSDYQMSQTSDDPHYLWVKQSPLRHVGEGASPYRFDALAQGWMTDPRQYAHSSDRQSPNARMYHIERNSQSVAKGRSNDRPMKANSKYQNSHHQIIREVFSPSIVRWWARVNSQENEGRIWNYKINVVRLDSEVKHGSQSWE